MTDWQVRRIFPRASARAIEGTITSAESRHAGQILFVVEGALHNAALFRGQSARARGIELFSQLRVWDTEHNNGVLIYVLLADRAVEIMADRGVHASVGRAGWDAICRQMEAAFGAGQYQEGVIGGIGAVARHLALHFPAHSSRSNELPDAPMIL